MLDGKSVTTHPLFVEGHQYAGTLFISVLVDVVQDVVPRWSGRGPRPPVKPKHVVLANRGFPIHVREAVEAGHRPIDPSDVKQLLVDYYATYPRRAQNRHTDYMQLQALLNGEWVEDERLTAANTLPLKGTPHCASEELVSEGLETASLALLFEPGNRQVSTMWV